MEKTDFIAPKIKCDGCAETISEALAGLEGVMSVSVDVKARKVTVEYDEDTVSTTSLRSALASAGYPPQ